MQHRTLCKTTISLVEDLMDHENAKIIKGFKSFDRKNTGFIKTEKLGMALRAMKLAPSEMEIEDCIKEFDPENTGQVNQDAFLEISCRFWYSDPKDFDSALWQAFLTFDDRDTGKLTPDHIRHIMLEMGEPLPEKEVEAMIKSETGRDGLVDYQALIRLWLR